MKMLRSLIERFGTACCYNAADPASYPKQKEYEAAREDLFSVVMHLEKEYAALLKVFELANASHGSPYRDQRPLEEAITAARVVLYGLKEKI